MKFIPKMILVCCALLPLQALAAAQTLTIDQVLQKMEKANSDYPSLQANIQRTRYKDIIHKTDDPQLGRIWVLHSGNAPRRIKVDFDKPVREFLLIEKGTFTHYFPATKDGETKSFAKESQAEGECIFLGLCQSSEVIKQYYDASLLPEETIDGIRTTVLELKPKDKKHTPGFASIRLWLDPTKWIPVQTRITEDNKNYTNAKYTEIKTAKFSDSVFNLDIPKGAAIKKLK